MIVRVTIYIVACLLIAAHFLRAGNVIGVALYLAAPTLFLLRQRWSLLLLQGLVYAAAVVWLWTAWQIVFLRQTLGQSWYQAAGILVAVAAVSLLAGGLLGSGKVRERYRGGR